MYLVMYGVIGLCIAILNESLFEITTAYDPEDLTKKKANQGYFVSK